jgi:hypothetical protein
MLRSRYCITEFLRLEQIDRQGHTPTTPGYELPILLHTHIAAGNRRQMAGMPQQLAYLLLPPPFQKHTLGFRMLHTIR